MAIAIPVLPDVASFFFRSLATPAFYTLSLHDALPISFFVPFGAVVYSVINIKLGEHIDINKDRKSGSAGMPRPISYAVFCLKKKKTTAGKASVMSSTMHLERRTRRPADAGIKTLSPRQ